MLDAFQVIGCEQIGAGNIQETNRFLFGNQWNNDHGLNAEEFIDLRNKFSNNPLRHRRQGLGFDKFSNPTSDLLRVTRDRAPLGSQRLMEISTFFNWNLDPGYGKP